MDVGLQSSQWEDRIPVPPSPISNSGKFIFAAMPATYRWMIMFALAAVYLAGMFVDIMEVDAAQYAAISREMAESGNYLQLFCRGRDYLDKPPLLFWTSALSFKLFGVSNFTYKLPSLLFTLLGLYSTYRLGKRLYDEQVGVIAAIMLSTTQAWFLFNNDIRTDTILAASVIFAVWQLRLFSDSGKLAALLGSSVGISLAMLAKGPIGLMVPLLAIGSDMLVRREWKKMLNWKWLLLPVLVLLFLSPMLYGLYTQFDLQPGKMINGQPVQSGLRFYFWSQSFGRITGESTWSDNTSYLEFLPVLGWSFLPWTFVLVSAVGLKLRELAGYHRDGRPNEFITLFGVLLPFIALSLSRYKLPHYIFVFYPLAAILSAWMAVRLFQGLNVLRKANIMILATAAVCYLVASALLLGYVFPLVPVLKVLIISATALAGLVMVVRSSGITRLVVTGVAGALVFNLTMNLHFYPELLKYQATSMAAQQYAAKYKGAGYPVFAYYALGYSFDVYAGQTMTYYEDIDAIERLAPGQRVVLYTDDQGLDFIRQKGLEVIGIYEYDYFKVSRLSLGFLNPKTRARTISKRYLTLIQTSEDSI